MEETTEKTSVPSEKEERGRNERSWTTMFGPGVDRESLKRFYSPTDFAVHALELEKKVSNSIVLPVTATTKDFKKALLEKGKIPAKAEIYDTVSDSDFERPLKEVALEQQMTQSEYKEFVETSLEEKKESEKAFEKTKKKLGIEDTDITEVENTLKTLSEAVSPDAKEIVKFPKDVVFKIAVLQKQANGSVFTGGKNNKGSYPFGDEQNLRGGSSPGGEKQKTVLQKAEEILGNIVK